jgi:hypothetical protein
LGAHSLPLPLARPKARQGKWQPRWAPIGQGHRRGMGWRSGQEGLCPDAVVRADSLRAGHGVHWRARMTVDRAESGAKWWRPPKKGVRARACAGGSAGRGSGLARCGSVGFTVARTARRGADGDWGWKKGADRRSPRSSCWTRPIGGAHGRLIKLLIFLYPFSNNT